MPPPIGIVILLIIVTLSQVAAQVVSPDVPKKISRSEKYLFYLHGGVVTVLGNNAINQSVPEWGPYEYLNILDSLKKQGFNIISENRKPDVDDSIYVKKLATQVNTLLQAGVSAKKIIVVGASAGWDIALRAASKLKNKKLHYVIMGGCWPDTYKDFTNMELKGHFLSIIEATDPHGPCIRIFEKRKVSSFKEVNLNTGLSHRFIYKGHREWIDPIVKWFSK